MDIDVNNGVLVDLVREQNEKIDRNTDAVRATNLLLLAKAMGIEDVTEPRSVAKVLRHMDVLESAVKTHG